MAKSKKSSSDRVASGSNQQKAETELASDEKAKPKPTSNEEVSATPALAKASQPDVASSKKTVRTRAKNSPFEQIALDSDVMQQKKPKIGNLIATCFCIMVLVLVTYCYTMTGQFVFNDAINYTQLRSVREATDFWLSLFSTGISSPYSQQWLKATYAWDIGSFGENGGWAHSVNICLHILSCIYFFVLVFRLGWRLNKDDVTKINPYYLAAASAALLACHPLTTGSIAYLSGRSGVLAGTNYFLALNCFLYGFFEEKLDKAFLGYMLFFLFTAIGVSSNVQCFTLPFAALALTFILKPRELSWKEWFADRWYEMVLLVLPGLGLCWLFTLGYPPQVDCGFALATLPAPIYWASQLKLLVTYYLRCLLVPFGLSVYPPFGIASGWSDPGTIAGAIVVAAVAAIGVTRKQPLIQFSVVIFLLGLMPWIFLVQPEYVADSRFYLPLAGIALACGVGIAKLAAIDFRKTAIAFAVLLVGLSALSIYREVQWSSEGHLWRSEVRNNPDNARAHAYLAKYFLNVQKVTEGRSEIEKAIKLDPDDFIAHSQQGFLYYQDKDYFNASKALHKTIQAGEKLNMPAEQMAIFHRQLAEAYMKMGDLNNADKEAKLAFPYMKGDPYLYLVSAKKQLEDHQPMFALQMLLDGFRLDKANPEYLEPIAQACLDTGVQQNFHQAYVASKRAIRITHTSEANQLYIRSCLELGKIEEAKVRLDVMRRQLPNDPNVIWLGYGYDKLAGNQAEAENERKRALAVDPDIEKRVKFYLRNPINAPEPPPIIVPKGNATQVPDLKKIDAKIPNILAPNNQPAHKSNDQPKPTTP